jgi:hypothetical protein
LLTEMEYINRRQTMNTNMKSRWRVKRPHCCFVWDCAYFVCLVRWFAESCLQQGHRFRR